ncbi:non-specific serine/threonine protein kinase [Anaeramoeba ignava]|uniref:non-specific serine/threonine protein kinase n=1 Tax=Anaeramoeba ignava TaxID=1746090 RepID=A0A9Q0LNR6_ANAIG|nr:non-specific serine/threonine protein kinase [Anaeramoeba ignava]
MGICNSKRRRLSLSSFELILLIGEGRYGRIYVAKEKRSQKKFAIKIINKSFLLDQKVPKLAFQERDSLCSISSPFVVKLYHCFQDEESLYFVMDWINGFDLFEHLNGFNTFPEYLVRFYAAELILALQHIHKAGFVHADLKPENILIDPNGHIALIDFGSSISKEIIESKKALPVLGSYQYMAPEALNIEKIGFEIDFWSLGAIIYEMVHGTPPHYAETQPQTIQNILTEELELNQEISEEIKSLLKGLLQKQPEKRLGFNGIDEIKNHPFFEGIDWDKVLKKEYEPFFIPGPKHLINEHKNQLEQLVLLSLIDQKDQKLFSHFDFNPFLGDVI